MDVDSIARGTTARGFGSPIVARAPAQEIVAERANAQVVAAFDSTVAEAFVTGRPGTGPAAAVEVVA